jgi:hypothetical protein
MKNESTYFIFARNELIKLITEIGSDIDKVIEIIEEDSYAFSLFEYNPTFDSNPAIILHEFVESGFEDYSTLTETEFNKLKNI